MNHVDLFTGIGGFHLAGEMVWGDKFNTIVHVEIDKFCQQVLKKHWPDVPTISDIRDYKYDGTTIDLLTGGFPCQPFSCAGKQGGKRDDRYLWPEMLRAISEVRPTWIIGENVAGIINMALDQVLSDLEDEGYTCQAFIIPACGKDAPHRRDRVWIVAHSFSDTKRSAYRRNSGGSVQNGQKQNKRKGCEMGGNTSNRRQDVAYTAGTGVKEMCERKITTANWLPEPNVGGMVDGLSSWLDEPDIPRTAKGVKDRVNRLKSLGNAIVPQVVAPIMETIKIIERRMI